MRVLTTGLEASGTRLLARVVESLGAEAIHRSVPHGQAWWDDPGPVDAVVVIVRDFWAIVPAQENAGHLDYWLWSQHLAPQTKVEKAITVLFAQVAQIDAPFTVVTYRALVEDTGAVVMHLAKFLNLPVIMPAESITDQDTKHRGLW